MTMRCVRKIGGSRRVVKWGKCDFVASNEVGADEEMIDVNGPPPDGVPNERLKVVAGALVEMSASEKDVALEEVRVSRTNRFDGTLRAGLSVADESSLPPAPADDGIIVMVEDADGAGMPGMAFSSNGKWAVVVANRVV